MLNENFTEILPKQIPLLFDEMEHALEGFHKDYYKSTVETFIQQHEAFFSQLELLTWEDVEDGSIAKQIGAWMADCVKERGKDITSKSKRDRYALDANLFMVSYILPSILEVSNGRVGKAITEEICSIWSENFKNSHIQAASIADIDGGFKRKLCYVTTATCLALNLGSDCEELNLLKAYRDKVLMQNEAGRNIVSQYYNIAPTIVKRIDALQNAKEIYVDLYRKYIGKCVQCIKNKEYDSCLSIYSEMVEKLTDRFVRTNR